MDELEAAIWAAMRRHNIPANAAGAEHFVGEVLRAAAAWSAGDSEDVTLRRRQVLARERAAAYGGRTDDDHLLVSGLSGGSD